MSHLLEDVRPKQIISRVLHLWSSRMKTCLDVGETTGTRSRYPVLTRDPNRERNGTPYKEETSTKEKLTSISTVYKDDSPTTYGNLSNIKRVISPSFFFPCNTRGTKVGSFHLSSFGREKDATVPRTKTENSGRVEDPGPVSCRDDPTVV